MNGKQKKVVKLVESMVRKVLNESNRVKYLPKSDYDKYNLAEFPNFSATGSVLGMKKLYYGKGAKLVKCGSYIYNVSSEPEIYDAAYDRPVK